jgi:hypothetical protein
LNLSLCSFVVFFEDWFSGRISLLLLCYTEALFMKRKPSIYDFLQGYSRSYKDIETLMLQSFFYRFGNPLSKGKSWNFIKMKGKDWQQEYAGIGLDVMFLRWKENERFAILMKENWWKWIKTCLTKVLIYASGFKLQKCSF